MRIKIHSNENIDTITLSNTDRKNLHYHYQFTRQFTEFISHGEKQKKIQKPVTSVTVISPQLITKKKSRIQ